jgi:xylulokinase
VITFKNAGGAVVINCMFGAYAVENITEIKEQLEDYLEIKKTYYPESKNTEKYRSLYQLQKQLVKQKMGPVFDLLEKLQSKEE